MKNTIMKATLVLIVLIGATIFSYYVSDHQAISPARTKTIVALAGLKFLLILWYFVGLKDSHRLWQGIGLFYALLFSLIAL